MWLRSFSTISTPASETDLGQPHRYTLPKVHPTTPAFAAMKSLFLLLLATFAALNEINAQDITSTLNEIFKGATLENMEVKGSITMTSGNDFSFEAITSVSNNGWGLETSVSLKDGKCDFRELQLGAQMNIIPPKSVQSVMAMLGIPSPIPVNSITRTLSFLPEDSNVTSLPTTTTIDAVSLDDPATAQIVALLGADAKFTIKNPTFMVTGMSFQLFIQGSVMGPTAGVCAQPWAVAALRQAASDNTICTAAGGIEIPETNLGQQLKIWLASANQPHAFIDATDGTITIGTTGLLCNLDPVAFQIKGKPGEQLQCLGDLDQCQSAVTAALVKAVNAQLPSGYTIDASQLKDLKINVDPTTGDVTIAGKMYAGAGKDPSALVQALRDYVANGGVLKIDDQAVDVDTRDITDDGDCLDHPDRVAASTCSPGAEPPASNIPGGTNTDKNGNVVGNAPSPTGPNRHSGDWNKKNFNDGGDGDNNTILIIGTVLITLAVVATVVGTVVVVKIVRKRSGTVRNESNFNRMNDNSGSYGGHAEFDSISLTQPSGSGREEPAVWGDVVDVRNQKV